MEKDEKGNILIINILKKLLPKELQKTIHTPITELRKVRGKQSHTIDPQKPFNAFEEFHKQVVCLDNSMAELKQWIESL